YHPCSRIAHVSSGAYRIAHVVKTIEYSYEVIVSARKLFGGSHAKVEANVETLFGGGCAGSFDGFVVRVEAEELRLRKGFGHQYGRSPLAASHIGDACASFELG